MIFAICAQLVCHWAKKLNLSSVLGVHVPITWSALISSYYRPLQAASERQLIVTTINHSGVWNLPW